MVVVGMRLHFVVVAGIDWVRSECSSSGWVAVNNNLVDSLGSGSDTAKPDRHLDT